LHGYLPYLIIVAGGTALSQLPKLIAMIRCRREDIPKVVRAMHWMPGREPPDEEPPVPPPEIPSGIAQ
jgi:hypothetical protein